MIFHHVGIPGARPRPDETYLEGARVYITDAGAHPYHIEWLRFAEGSPMPQALQTAPHVAFLVEDLNAAMAGKTVVVEPFEPMPGLRVGFIEEDGAYIELMQKTA